MTRLCAVLRRVTILANLRAETNPKPERRGAARCVVHRRHSRQQKTVRLEIPHWHLVKAGRLFCANLFQEGRQSWKCLASILAFANFAKYFSISGIRHANGGTNFGAANANEGIGC